MPEEVDLAPSLFRIVKMMKMGICPKCCNHLLGGDSFYVFREGDKEFAGYECGKCFFRISNKQVDHVMSLVDCWTDLKIFEKWRQGKDGWPTDGGILKGLD